MFAAIGAGLVQKSIHYLGVKSVLALNQDNTKEGLMQS
jgi:hypothetical protein